MWIPVFAGMTEYFFGHWGNGTMNSRVRGNVDSRLRGNDGVFECGFPPSRE